MGFWIHFWGESPNGTWTLEVSQNEGNVGRKPGILKTWQLIMYGTDEYSPMGPQFPKDDDIENEEGEDEDDPSSRRRLQIQWDHT